MDIKPLPQTPVLSPDVDKTSRMAFGDIHTRINQLIKWLGEVAKTVLPHKDTHKTGGSDALTPIDIGAASADHTHSASLYVPPGAVMAFARSTPPDGWLECNGAAVSRTTYAALFAAIGTTFGGGDGATTFNLPDLRGEFIRGWDHGRGVDSGRAFGSFQIDTFQGHWHEIRFEYDQSSGSGYPKPLNGGSRYARDYSYSWVRNPISDGTNGTPRTSSETRPRNIAFLWCIKY